MYKATKTMEVKRFSGFAFLLCTVLGCDPEGQRQCAWTLEPEPKLKGKVQQGYIPVCARNRQTMKQDCRFQATMEQAREALGKKFRYADVKVASPALPRTITSITYCD